MDSPVLAPLSVTQRRERGSCAELRIPESRIPFSTSKDFLNWDSRIRIYLTWDDKQMVEYFISQFFKRRTIKQVASCGQF